MPNRGFGAPTGTKERCWGCRSTNTGVGAQQGEIRSSIRSLDINIEATIQPELCQCELKSVGRGDLNVQLIRRASICAVERGQEVRSTIPRGVAPQGGYQGAHRCVIDEGSGFRSNIYHRGWAICTSILILRNHNSGRPTSWMFRQRKC